MMSCDGESFSAPSPWEIGVGGRGHDVQEFLQNASESEIYEPETHLSLKSL